MDEILTRLSLREIEILVDSLESKSLRSPFTEVGFKQVFGNNTGPDVFRALQHLSSQAFTDDQILTCLNILKNDREKRGKSIADAVSLVWTGPEAPGIINRDTKVVVQELFSKAQESVLVAGFAVYQGRDVFKALAAQMDSNPNLKVSMYLNVQRRHMDTTASEFLLKDFADKFKRKDWPGKRLPEVYYDPRSLVIDSEKKAVLHAKCIVVDRKTTLVSSANFTEAAQERNIEAGVLIESAPFSDQLQGHFEALRELTLLRPLWS